MGYFKEESIFKSSSRNVNRVKCSHKSIKEKVLISLLAIIFLLVGCNTTSPSWAYDFVKYDNRHYVPIDEEIKIDELNEKIGQVKVFLNEEQDSFNLSSNKFAEGTALYSIKGVDVKQEIVAVEKEGRIFKLRAE